MKQMRALLPALKLMLFLLAVLVAHAQYTDADLFDQESVKENSMQATTLDFSALDTVNQIGRSLFFSVSGLLPSGFQVESVRIKNEGKMEYPFSVTVQRTGGSEALCTRLNLRVFRDWKELYTGSLTGVDLQGALSSTEPWEDLVFVVSLDVKEPELKQQTCAFSFVFTSQAQTSFFRDTERLENIVNTGTWAD